jgi:molybdopterin-synthase adenylyltransferase
MIWCVARVAKAPVLFARRPVLFARRAQEPDGGPCLTRDRSRGFTAPQVSYPRGIGQVALVKTHNLDRLLHATEADVRLGPLQKVETLRSALLLSATAARARVDALEYSVVEEPGWSRALDCDVLFSCVDRPWPRAMLNLAAYGHLIPVVDGGILVRVREEGGMLSADWKTHVAAPGRRCLECLKQYEPGHVGVERDGLLDDPSYVEGLPLDHPLRANANVFPFSMSAAAFEVLHLISMVAAPNGVSDLGGLTYHAVPGMLRTDDHACEPTCVFSTQFLGAGDSATALVEQYQAAERERADRARRARSPSVRLRRAVSSFGRRLSTFRAPAQFRKRGHIEATSPAAIDPKHTSGLSASLPRFGSGAGHAADLLVRAV